MKWLHLKLQATKQQAHAWSEYCSEIGAIAVSLEDGSNQPLFNEPSPITQLQPEQPLWDKVNIIALFDANIDPIQTKLQLAKIIDSQALQSASFEILADQDWVKSVQDNFQPIQCSDNLWICPSWAEVPDPTAINIFLDPGMAFGTGSHPTTALCIQWLANNIHNNSCIIDYGCGSGILAIAASKLGASNVYATDIDPNAVQTCLANAKQNLESWQHFVCTLPQQMPTNIQADILIANILANPLLELAPKFYNLIKPGGKIVLSGILNNQVQLIQNTYSEWFSDFTVQYSAEWACIVAQKIVRCNINQDIE